MTRNKGSTTIQPSRNRRPVLVDCVVLAASAVAAAAYSYVIGQDANYDQLHYHYYDPYALLHGGLARDAAPAGIQTYLNPAIYLPFYELVRTVPPALAGLVLGAIHGVNFWLVLVVARRVTGGLSAASVAVACAAAMALSVGPATVAEIGTSFADILTSIPILAGVAILLPLGTGNAPAQSARRAMIAAFLVGAAVSLKLTNGIYAIGFAATCLVGWENGRDRLMALARTAAGGIAGFIVAGGPWYWAIWTRFGNPFYPFYNGIFAAPGYPKTSFHDPLFQPKSLLDGLSYPFRTALGGHPGEVVPFRDVRFAVLAILGVAAVIFILYRRTAAPAKLTATWTVPQSRLLVFVAVSYLVWIYQFGIERYLVAAELLAGPAIVVALLPLARRRIAWASVAVAVLALAGFQGMDWNHTAWGKTWYRFAENPPQTPRSLYFLSGPPIAYVVPDLAAGSAAVGVEEFDIAAGTPGPVSGRVAALLRDPAYTRRRLIFSPPLPLSDRKTLASYGLEMDGDCRRFTNVMRRLFECGLSKVDDTPSLVMPVGPGQVLSFGFDGNGGAALIDGWSQEEDWGIWALGRDSRLELRLAQALGPGPFVLRAHALAGVAPGNPIVSIGLFVNDGPLAPWMFDIAHADGERTACLPVDAIGADRMLSLRFHDDAPRSPAEMGVNADTRPLSIGLRTLTVTPAAAGECG